MLLGSYFIVMQKKCLLTAKGLVILQNYQSKKQGAIPYLNDIGLASPHVLFLSHHLYVSAIYNFLSL